MSEFTLLVLGAKEAAEAVLKSAIKRKAEQTQSAKEAADAVLKSAIKRLQAERTVNKGVQDVQAEVLSSTDSAVRERLQRWTK